MAAAEIQELNLAYLLLAQRLLAEDRETGMFQLNITEDMADLLMSLSSRALARLSTVNQFLFRLRFSESGQLEKLIEDERDQGLTQTHTAIVLSSAASSEV